LIEWIFDSILRTAPFLSFFPAIALSALLGGWRPGLFSAAILALLGWYFIIPPKYSFAVATLQDGVLLFFYCFASGLTLLIVILLDRMRSQASAAHHRAEIIAAELAKREAELKLSQDRLRAATDAAALGIFEWVRHESRMCDCPAASSGGPAVPSAVPYEVGRLGNEPSKSPRTMYPAVFGRIPEPRGDGMSASIEADRG
jgi:hypothetical protein